MFLGTSVASTVRTNRMYLYLCINFCVHRPAIIASPFVTVSQLYYCPLSDLMVDKTYTKFALDATYMPDGTIESSNLLSAS